MGNVEVVKVKYLISLTYVCRELHSQIHVALNQNPLALLTLRPLPQSCVRYISSHRHENPCGLLALSRHSWLQLPLSGAQGFGAVWKVAEQMKKCFRRATDRYIGLSVVSIQPKGSYAALFGLQNNRHPRKVVLLCTVCTLTHTIILYTLNH